LFFFSKFTWLHSFCIDLREKIYRKRIAAKIKKSTLRFKYFRSRICNGVQKFKFKFMKLLTQLSVISYLDRKKPQVLNYDLSTVGILAAHTVCTKEVLMRQCFASALWFQDLRLKQNIAGHKPRYIICTEIEYDTSRVIVFTSFFQFQFCYFWLQRGKLIIIIFNAKFK